MSSGLAESRAERELAPVTTGRVTPVGGVSLKQIRESAHKVWDNPEHNCCGNDPPPLIR